MSRCFSFPPPNYELSDERIGIMMELIELKEEKEKRREERRERRNRRRKERREKRERTREEKERRERKKEEKRRERKERSEVQKIEVESKVERRDGEMEQSSSLTEEHGYPDSLPVGSSSPENSNKRKNWFTSEASSSIHSPENSNKRKNWFTSEASSSIHQMDRSLGDAVMHGLEILQCKDVVERLLPPEVEDSDWLCPNTRREEKRQRCGSDSLTLSCSRASTPWPPRAQYLHHIDAYALPYILPF